MQTTQCGSHKFQSKRLSISLIGLLAVVALGVLGTHFLISPVPRGALPVLSTTGWVDRNSKYFHNPHYAWLANGDLTYLAPGPAGKVEVRYQKMDANGPVGVVRRGPELPPLETGPFWEGAFFPSPDERWVAYRQFSNADQDQTALVSADGKTKRTLPEEFGGWFSDSRSFLVRSLTINPYPWKVYHLDAPTTETIPETIGSDMVSLVSAMANGPDVLIGDFALDPQSNMEVPLTASTVTLRSLHVSKSNIILHKWQVQIPLYAKSVSVSASPDNKQLLWRISRYGRHPPFWVQWLYGLNPNWQRPTPDEIQYFLSDLQAGGMHSVLHCSLSASYEFSPLWTPDSKHVSFIFQDQLYQVPID